MNKPSILALALAALLTSGCMSHAVRSEIDQDETTARGAVQNLAARNVTSRVSEIDELFVPVTRIEATNSAGAWLRKKKVNVDLKEPVPLSTIVRMLAEEGVNVVTTVPRPEDYTYAGVITGADAETVLRVVLGTVGLSYETDDARQIVTIRPMPSRTWHINLGNRKTSYASGAAQGGSASSGGQGQRAGGSAGQGFGGGGSMSGNGGMGDSLSGGGIGSQGGSNSGGSGGAGSALASNNSMNGTGIQIRDDFWGSLAVELENRLSMLAEPPSHAQAAPFNPLSPMPMAGNFYPMGGQGPAPALGNAGLGGRNENRKAIGTFALNPETGAITVQAPHWILSDLDSYFTQVQRMYNADISFQGEVLLVTHTRTDSEGLDVASFGNFASGRYGAVVSNNALGGVTVNFPDGGKIPNVVAGAQPVAGALIGAVSAADGLQVFNAWLSEVGRVSVMQRPVMTTTSSVPAEFRREFNRCFNTISQQVAGGGVGSAVQGTTNTLECKDFGIAITINPRYDLSANLIRAQISLNHVLPAGEQLIQQTVSVGDTFRSIPTRIPLETRAAYSGEALLRDGDLIIVGGQTEDSSALDENGLPGNKGAISGIFGTKRANRESKTYYFALRVSVKPRGLQQ